MRFLDLLGMSISNLKRRKMRTFLTVLGVVIGTASVVIMVSLGIGLNDLMMEQYSSYGDMTMITVYTNGYYGGGQEAGSLLLQLEYYRRVQGVSGEDSPGTGGACGGG